MRSVIAGAAQSHGRVILLALCSTLFIAQFYSAWSWPAIDGYPAIERFIDPGWLTTDFYTNAVAGFGPDTVPAVIFGTLQKITGISYEVWIAIANLARCIAIILLLYGFLRTFTGDGDTALAGTVLGTLSGFMMPDAPGWYWIGGTAEPSGFALAFVMGGWIFALQQRLWAACLLLALALPFHPVIALHGALFTALIFLSEYGAKERMATLLSARTILSALVFAAVLLGLYFTMTGGVREHLPTQEYVRILAYERHAHHFVPSAFGARTWILFALAMIALAALFWRFREHIPRPRLVLATIAAYGVLALAGYVFVEIVPIRLVVQLIPYRFCIALCPVFLAVMATFLMAQIQARHLLPAATTVLVYLSAPLAVGNRDGFIIHAAILVLFTLAVLRLPGSEATKAPDDWEHRLFERRTLGGTAASVLILMSLFALPVDMTIPTPENQHPVYKWLAANTAPDAVFLVAQSQPGTARNNVLSPQKVRLVGNRAVVASQDFPFREDYFHEWHDRWQTALRARNINNVDVYPEQRLIEIAERFPFDYVLRTRPLENPHRLKEVARIGSGSGTPVYIYEMPAPD